MKTRKTYHPCFCAFVPPYVLERLSQSREPGIDEKTRQAAQASLTQDNQIRAQRAAEAANTPSPGTIMEGVMAPPQGTAGREVYSCNAQWGEPPPFSLMR